MATPDLEGHALLTTTELSTAQLTAHTRMAEQVLGLAATTLTGDELEAAKDALVLQVNFQVDTLPHRDWGTIIKEKPFEYWAEDVGVHPVALRIAGRLVGAGQKVATASVKPHVSTPLLATAAEQTAREALTTSKKKPFHFEIT